MLIISFLFLIYIFFVSRKITSGIYKLIYLLSKSEKLAVGVLSAVILPGTIFHELSHFLIASLLRVPTGKLTVFPKMEEKGTIRTGRLEMAQTDPFRHSLIGLAPLFTGIILIYLIGYYFFGTFKSFSLTTHNLPHFAEASRGKQLTTFIGLYLLFMISNTMFTSKKDLEGLKIALPIVIIFSLSLYIVGVRLIFEKTLLEKINLVITNMNYYLVIISLVNFAVFGILELSILFWQKMLRKKIVFK
jgi:hypothetical protein